MALVALAACSSDSHSDLAAYIDEVKARKAGRIAPLPEVKNFESYQYNKADLRDPFKPAGVEAVSEAVTSAGLQPDVQRNKEPLEAFPLDSLRFVGHMEQEGRVWAVITAPDSLVYRVEEGNYLGQNFGRISLINESQIDIKEIIPNGLGGWTERDATLTLEE
jgi:type IV pilus assembly protein PilP